MKVFAVTTDLTLTQKPSWFDEIREKYNQSFDLHITLKQPCFIDDNKIPALKEKVSQFFSNNKFSSMTLVFDEVVYDKEEQGWTIMLICKSDQIVNVQKELYEELDVYNDYVKPETEAYETNFVPHMTFAAKLSDAQYEEVTAAFSGDYMCTGVVRKGPLLIASEDARQVLEQIEYELLL